MRRVALSVMLCWVPAASASSSGTPALRSLAPLRYGDPDAITRNQQLDQCHQSVESVTVSGTMGTGEYAAFLELYYGQDIQFDAFEDIPSSLRTIFLSMACSTGIECTNENPPMISFEQDMRNEERFCASISELDLHQVVHPFQFEIQYEADADDVGTFHENGYKRKVQSATESMFINQLELTEQVEEDPDSLLGLAGLYDTDDALQDIDLQDRYHIQSTVLDVMNVDCLPPPPGRDSEDDAIATKEAQNRCVLISSSVKVTAVSSSFETTHSTLRKTVSRNLKGAFRNNMLEQYLK